MSNYKKVILKQNIQNKIKLINEIVISIDRRYIFQIIIACDDTDHH